MDLRVERERERETKGREDVVGRGRRGEKTWRLILFQVRLVPIKNDVDDDVVEVGSRRRGRAFDLRVKREREREKEREEQLDVTRLLELMDLRV